MTDQHNLKNIYTLLTEEFTDEALRRLCYDVPELRPVYDQLTQNSGKAQVVDRLLKFAKQEAQIGMILSRAKEHSSVRDERDQPWSLAGLETPQPAAPHLTATDQIAPEVVEALRQSYLNQLLGDSSQLPLEGIDPVAASREAEARLNLGAVYTALLTLSPKQDKQQRGDDQVERNVARASALAQLDRRPYLVLLGDPGSGKTTFVNFVAMCLAGEALQQQEANLKLLTAPLPKEQGQERKRAKRQPWQHGALLPVRVILRDFAASKFFPAEAPGKAKHLWNFIADTLALPDFIAPLQHILLQQGGLLLLDGLDEIPEASQRRVRLKQIVEDFVRVFPQCHILVTSRTYAYQQQDWRLARFAEAVLAPFSEGQIRRFVERWYQHTAALRGIRPEYAQGRATLLNQAIFGNNSRLRELAERPLLLTLMASLHAWRGGNLPEKREELYAETVDLLLDRWERPKVVRDATGQTRVEQPSLVEWLCSDRAAVRALLHKLAYQAHARQPELVGTADVPEGDLVGGLLQLSQNPDVKPVRLVEYLSQRAGLLLPRGEGVYTFPHRTLQEYMTACYLTEYNYPDEVAELARADPNRWREVVLLAGAKTARGSPYATWGLIEALCHSEVGTQPDGETEAWGALLAGQMLVESLESDQVRKWNRPKVERVQARLVNILEKGQLPTFERVAAGRLLGRLGDPREGVTTLPPGLTGRIEGPFWYGEGEAKKKIEVAPFRAGVYPVTNAQYAQFIAAGGYENPAWWSKEGWTWLQKSEAGRSKQPLYWDGPNFNSPNQPVVGVSYHEAEAFCHWLTAWMQERGQLKPGEVVRLPSEAEWERLARGQDGREYPWGDGWRAGVSNTAEANLGQPTAVGLFPAGVSPEGVYDCAGNVWEWCADWDDKDAGIRVLRGGSWVDSQEGARCGSRGWDDPYHGYHYYGFRLVSPV